MNGTGFNVILVIGAALLAVFGGLSIAFTSPALRIIGSLVLGCASGFMAWKWRLDAWNSVRKGTLDDDNIAPILWWMAAFGIFLMSLYGMAWNILERPESWVRAPIYPLFQLIAAFGFFGMAVLPLPQSVEAKKLSLVLYILGAIVLVASGYTMGHMELLGQTPDHVLAPPFR